MDKKIELLSEKSWFIMAKRIVFVIGAMLLSMCTVVIIVMVIPEIQNRLNGISQFWVKVINIMMWLSVGALAWAASIFFSWGFRKKCP